MIHKCRKLCKKNRIHKKFENNQQYIENYEKVIDDLIEKDKEKKNLENDYF